MISDAVGLERISKTIGYKIAKGNFSETSPNLPQKVVIIGEANSGVTVDTEPFEFTDAYSVGLKYGFGSPLHQTARILRPVSGGGIGGIPTTIYAQEEPVGATFSQLDITVGGTAMFTGVHKVMINGRDSVDGVSYNINVLKNDTAVQIASKINDAINNAISVCPFTSTVTGAVVSAVTKWKGETAKKANITIAPLNSLSTITYSVVNSTVASGTPTVTASLNKIGNEWATIVVNTYGIDSAQSVIGELMSFNGIPSANTPTGRYSGIVMKPFIALTGSTADNDTIYTDAFKDDVTIAICPAPLSKGMPLEASANMCVLFARQAQDNPYLDVAGMTYPDMPTPTFIGTMTDYNNRDLYVKKGNSTVDLLSGKYRVIDFITTYHPLGEAVPQFRFCRSLVQDFNIRFGYYLLENINVVNHAIAGDDDVVTVEKVVKPKQWKAIINGYAEDLAKRGIIADAQFMQKGISVGLSATNPDRLETHIRYKRSGFARILATTGEAGFNFGK